MNQWRPQQYLSQGKSHDVDPGVLNNACRIGTRIIQANPNVIPVFTLNNLAHHTGVSYGYLRSIVSRSGAKQSYRTFKIHKRPDGRGNRQYRVISVPSPKLKNTLTWITKNILNHVQPHHSSTAFAPQSKIIESASLHCGCKWLVKIDIKNFFESISEISVYRVFLRLGYEPLISFELARLCTKLSKNKRSWESFSKCWHTHYVREKIPAYFNYRIGYLPQGAPTSPMLSNLVMLDLDSKLSKLASEGNLTYTRYADDFAISSHDPKLGREGCKVIIKAVYKLLLEYGFSPNTAKTKICTPGSRKMILGLLVNGNEPRLPRNFKENLRQHFYYLTHEKHGPSQHARARNFDSVFGLRNHVEGLVSYACQVEPIYGHRFKKQFLDIDWPL